MIQRLFAVLLVMVALVGSVRAEDVKEVVIASAEELKGIKAKKIAWVILLLKRLKFRMQVLVFG